MAKANVADRQNALDAARKAGCDAEHVMALIEHYTEVGGWKPGALRNRVKSAHPGLAVSAGWPEPTGKPRSRAAPVPEFDRWRNNQAAAIRAAGREIPSEEEFRKRYDAHLAKRQLANS